TFSIAPNFNCSLSPLGRVRGWGFLQAFLKLNQDIF
ncbi:hypothetical protein COXBURSA334_0349, partial [Coxiella burnetii Q321]